MTQTIDERTIDEGRGLVDYSPAPALVRAVVAGDDVLFREGLVSLLERRGFDVTGQVGLVAHLLPLVRSTAPDLVVISIHAPSDHPEEYEAARLIRAEFPDTGVLVLCARVEVQHAIDALVSGGGISYLLNNLVTDVEDFVDILKRIARGTCVVGPAVAEALMSARGNEHPLAALSTREHEVLKLMAEGRSNTGIARRLHLSEGTIEKHVHNIMTKLGIREGRDLHRRVQAVIAFLHGQ